MATLWPTYTFRVNLQTQHLNDWLQPSTPTEEINLPNTRSTWLPGQLAAENIAVGNGGTFTASGLRAIYLKKTYCTGVIGDMLVLISS